MSNLLDLTKISVLYTDKIAIGYEKITLNNNTTVKKLASIPADANYAICRFLVASAATDKSTSFRYTFGGNVTASQPTTSEGMFIGDKEAIDINERENLENFRIINSEAGVTNYIYVLYFK